MPTWFKSNPLPLTFDTENIDTENGIIKKVVMAQVGPAKGHGVNLDQSFIDALIAYDVKHYSKTGIKARFGHPALSDTTMGTQMGMFKNFSVDGENAIADLHFLDSADKSPTKPGMKTWMFSMAKEANDFVMSSIVFKPSGHYQVEPETNKKIPLSKRDEYGQLLLEVDDEPVYVEFDPEKGAQHLYTDMVEAGAATNSLFSQQFNKDKFAVRTVTWLQENPDILSFIQANPHKIIEMCAKLNIPLEMSKKNKLFTAFKEFFASEEETTEEVVDTSEEVEGNTEETEAPDDAGDTDTDEAAPDEKYDALMSGIAELTRTNDALTKRLTELEKNTATPPVNLTEDTDDVTDNSLQLCATTLRAMGKRR